MIADRGGKEWPASWAILSKLADVAVSADSFDKWIHLLQILGVFGVMGSLVAAYDAVRAWRPATGEFVRNRQPRCGNGDGIWDARACGVRLIRGSGDDNDNDDSAKSLDMGQALLDSRRSRLSQFRLVPALLSPSMPSMKYAQGDK